VYGRLVAPFFHTPGSLSFLLKPSQRCALTQLLPPDQDHSSISPNQRKKKTTRQKVVCQCYFVTSSTTFSFPPISPPPLRPLFFLHNGRAASVPPSPAPGYVCNWGVGAYFKIYLFFQPGSFFFLCPLSLSVPPLLFLPRSYIFFFPFYFTNQIFFLKKIKKKIMP